MLLNATKIKTINFSLRKDMVMLGNIQMNSNTHNVENVECLKLLGIGIDNQMTFQNHITKIRQSAMEELIRYLC